MEDDPQRKHRTRNPLVYALIPLGFVLIVGIIMLAGYSADEADRPGDVPVAMPEAEGADGAVVAQ